MNELSDGRDCNSLCHFHGFEVRKTQSALGGFVYLLDELRQQIGNEQMDVLLNDTVNLCNGLCDNYKDLSKKIHTEQMIFPRTDGYLMLEQ